VQILRLPAMEKFEGSVILPAAVDALIDMGIVSKVRK
jgi:hypothetical protein